MNYGSAPNSNTRTKTKVCLETSVFTTLYGRDEAQAKVCRDLLGDARDERIECYVSALALIESDASSDEFVDLFESEFLTRCNVDPFNGELARRLRSEIPEVTSLEPTAWLWLATALLEECDYLMTYHRRLLKLSGHTALGKLKVCTPSRPWDAGQLSLEDIEGALPTLPLVHEVTRRSITI
jgi:predicted nucleic acid-binding protein